MTAAPLDFRNEGVDHRTALKHLVEETLQFTLYFTLQFRTINFKILFEQSIEHFEDNALCRVKNLPPCSVRG